MCYVNLWKEGIKMGNNILIMSLSNNLENNIKKAKRTKKEYRWGNKKFNL